MSGFNTIKKSRKRSHEIEEKLKVLNRELEKTKDIQEQPTMNTSGIYVKSEDQANQDYSDFESKSFGGEGLGFSGADGNTAGNASIGDASGFSGVALSPPHPVTGVRVSAVHIRDGTGGSTPLRPGVTITRGFSDNPPLYTMGSCLWFYDSDFNNGAGQPAGKWCNLEFSNFEGDSNGKWFFWDTNNSGFFVVNTDLSQHPCGDISSLIDDLNFPGDGGALGTAFNTVMTQNRLDDPDFLPISIKDLAVQAFKFLKDKASQAAEAAKDAVDFMRDNFESNMDGIMDDLKDHWAQSWEDVKDFPNDLQDFADEAMNIVNEIADKVPVMDYAIDIAQSMTDNEPKNKTETSQEDIDRYIGNTNISNKDLPINSKPVGYADDNIYVDNDGNVKSNIGPNGEKGYYRRNNTDTWSEVPGGKFSLGITNPIQARGNNQTQIIWDGNGKPILRVTDHAYFNSQSTDKGEVPGLGFFNPKLVLANLFTRISDKKNGRTGGEEYRTDRRTGRVDYRPDTTTANTGAMEGYPPIIRGDSVLEFDIPFDEWPEEQKEQWEKRKDNLTTSTTQSGKPIKGYDSNRRKNDFNTTGTYVPESVKLGQFEPKVLDVDINQLRKNIKPEFPKDPPPEIIDGYSVKSRLAPKKIEREPFIKITKKDLAQNHKLTDKEISDFMNDVKMINDYIKKNPADLIYAQQRYPKHDPRLAQLNWQMDQMLDASKKYVDRQFPENKNLFNKIKNKIKKTIDQTDPKNFKPVKDPIKYVDVNKKKKLKETVTRHFNKPVKSKSMFGLNMSKVRKTNQKMIEKREQEQKVKEEERAYIQEKMSRQKSNWKDDLTTL